MPVTLAPHTLHAVLAEMVRAGAVRKQMSHADLAAAVGITPKHLSSMLTGRASGSLDVWQRLLDVVECPLDARPRHR